MRIYPSNFTAVDRTPFFYIMTHKVTGNRYAGSKTRKGCKPEDLGVTYFSSSKIVNQIINSDGVDSFLYRVVRVFSDVMICREHESNFLRRINAARRSDWYNQTNGGGKFITTKESAYKSGLSQRGKKVSDETRQKQSELRKGSKNHFFGKTHTDSVKLIIAKANTNPSDEKRKRLSDASKSRNRKTCKFCKHEYDIAMYTRWHGVYCSENPLSARDFSKTIKQAQRMNSLPPMTCKYCGMITSKGNYTRWHGSNCHLQMI